MELHARLVHAEAGLRVVEVSASAAGRSLGSALAEAATAQEAEDLAMARLLRRLDPQERAEAALFPRHDRLERRQDGQRRDALTGASALTEPSVSPSRPPASPGPEAARGGGRTGEDILPAVARPAAAREPDRPSAPPPAPDPRQPSPAIEAPLPGGADPDTHDAVLTGEPHEEPPADPEDWSQELAAVDLELRRLGWTRDEEGTYLQRAFGHPSRSRLTRYSDLRAYLTALEGLERGSDPAVAAVPLRRSELLAQGDALLAQLGWSADQGRAFLERELNRISRQQLSDVQLLQFNMLLEGEVLAAAGQV